MANKEETVEKKEYLNFIEQIIEEDLSKNKNSGVVVTRFPPEPNGYLHIGHAKSICLNFGLAQKYNGTTNLRFDDTNPAKEDVEYVNSIKEDVEWLGFKWQGDDLYTSNYFDTIYKFATDLIKTEKAYVCEQTAEEIAQFKGTPTKAGTASPYRNRPIEESLELFEKMKNGEIEEGKMSLRAKIDMTSPNMHMRDPLMYRIKKEVHHRTGDKWNIYPMYDFAHGQSDYIEGITHSVCTLEFEVHRPLYNWFLDQIAEEGKIRPQQIEFARLNMTYTIMSKRKLLQLVQENHVSSWDDPRMPTVSGLRRRGYTAASIRNFADRIGIAKRNNIIDVSLLEFSVREDLNKTANRVMGVLNPLKVIITNYPEGQSEELPAVNNPEDESKGTRMVPFSKELYIEQEDFKEEANRKFFRLKLGGEVRLRYAYFIKCNNVVKDENGNIIEVHCTYDPLSKGGKSPDGRKVKGTLHWVDANNNVKTEVRLYDRLFKTENPDVTEDGGSFLDNINQDSLTKIEGIIEPSIKTAKIGANYQFERLGYFCVDKDTTDSKMVLNRTVPLRDGWSRKSDKK